MVFFLRVTVDGAGGTAAATGGVRKEASLVGEAVTEF